MKSLSTLIKLQKTVVDEQRQHLARLQENLDQVLMQMDRLEKLKLREQAAAKDPVARMTYGAFIKGIIDRSKVLEHERQIADAAVKKAQDKLAELFEEQKRYEIAEEQRLEKEAREERRLETIELDEIGGVRHRRKAIQGE